MPREALAKWARVRGSRGAAGQNDGTRGSTAALCRSLLTCDELRWVCASSNRRAGVVDREYAKLRVCEEGTERDRGEMRMTEGALVC